MILAIDPDVLVAADANRICELALLDLMNNATEYDVKFAIDQGVIESEYHRLYLEWLEKDPDHWMIQIFEQILNDEHLRYHVSTLLEASDKQLIENSKCTEPVEPQLLGMVANAYKQGIRGLRLLLIGPTISHPRKRPRQLFEIATQNQFKAVWPGLDVRFVSDSQFHSSLFDDPKSHPKSKEFEARVALFLPTKRPKLQCMDSPLPEKIDGKNIGDVDVFGYDEDDQGRLIVLIGECKLREEGKESKRPITCDELEKLYVRMKAAREHKLILEKARDKQGLIIDGIFVSNAKDFEYNADERAKEYGIRVYQAELTKNWERDQHWKIKGLIQVL